MSSLDPVVPNRGIVAYAAHMDSAPGRDAFGREDLVVIDEAEIGVVVEVDAVPASVRRDRYRAACDLDPRRPADRHAADGSAADGPAAAGFGATDFQFAFTNHHGRAC